MVSSRNVPKSAAVPPRRAPAAGCSQVSRPGGVSPCGRVMGRDGVRPRVPRSAAVPPRRAPVSQTKPCTTQAKRFIWLPKEVKDPGNPASSTRVGMIKVGVLERPQPRQAILLPDPVAVASGGPVSRYLQRVLGILSHQVQKEVKLPFEATGVKRPAGGRPPPTAQRPCA
ncbi:hypothetical protein NHX12_021743 [Muraenolepis orangiensis]|uniref:Uncharacterized protein n=1 Tax=Muraenolepis orangiensis TaxID=630683 RepID=A0A9Q0EQN2_9TELE|nr:hypothetical protein NHX12_021743 [Muraenolepis orangiensis]